MNEAVILGALEHDGRYSTDTGRSSGGPAVGRVIKVRRQGSNQTVRVLEEFWRLTAMRLSPTKMAPRLRSEYDRRAVSVHDTVNRVPRDKQQDGCSSSTPHSLMRPRSAQNGSFSRTSSTRISQGKGGGGCSTCDDASRELTWWVAACRPSGWDCWRRGSHQVARVADHLEPRGILR
jgi:hypothetical protein